ncbi:hypothetical protein HOLleu_12048 [Holothuria leucospilota]|uniref:Uncharacterized protein n=1 Tax=Holothuria leucospilota TaxID=206669 RepID=A0A9Q1C9L2_HOLLE|nr:hypothetical protein HOLleu_12048 [Holothuria leucospilota]
MSAVVSSVIKSSSIHLRNIGRVRKYLSTDECMAVQCLTTLRIDCCSTLLGGINKNHSYQKTLKKNAK